jgi:hypothetical protein
MYAVSIRPHVFCRGFALPEVQDAALAVLLIREAYRIDAVANKQATHRESSMSHDSHLKAPKTLRVCVSAIILLPCATYQGSKVVISMQARPAVSIKRSSCTAQKSGLPCPYQSSSPAPFRHHHAPRSPLHHPHHPPLLDPVHPYHRNECSHRSVAWLKETGCC